jgi:5-(aminomethyl)-3-furanmethanol phosphate kinase
MKYPVVVKIGGSLMDYLDPILDALHRQGLPVLIVPGGGRFADLVGETGISGDAAHWMAIAAMEQMGWYIASKGVSPVTLLQVPDRVEVLLPYTLLRNADPLPHSWDITSDTISAWIASRLSLTLILLKSVDGIRSGGILQDHVTRDIPTDDVDPCFIRYVIDSKVKTIVINGRTPGRLELLLEGGRVPGTTIGF